MFITEELTPAETLSELLNLRGFDKQDTERFKSLRHNDDLCPGFQEQLNIMLDAYASHRADVHDIQGPRDEGVDVLLRYNDGGTRRIGLQIKSYSEIENWAARRDREFMLRLKAQCLAAQNLGVDDYYLLLCTDEIRHRNQIRLICSELKLVSPLKIILPRKSLAFFEMQEMEVQARVTRLLCSQDRVLKSAIEVVNSMSRDCAYLLIAAMCHAFEGNFLLTEKDIAGFYDDWLQGRNQQQDDGDRLGLLVDELQSYGLSLADGGFQIDISELPIALSALHFDLKFRRDGDMVAGLSILLDLFAANPKKRQRRRRAKPSRPGTLKRARAGI